MVAIVGYISCIIVALYLYCTYKNRQEKKKIEERHRRNSHLWSCLRGAGWMCYGWEDFINYSSTKPEAITPESKSYVHPPAYTYWYYWESYIPTPASEATRHFIARFCYQYMGNNLWTNSNIASRYLHNQLSIELDFQPHHENPSSSLSQLDTAEWVELYIPESEHIKTGIREKVLYKKNGQTIHDISEEVKHPICVICFGKIKPKFVTARIAICQRCINLIRDSIIDSARINKIILNTSFRLRCQENELLAGVIGKRLRAEEREAIRLRRALELGILISESSPVQDRPEKKDWEKLRNLVMREDGKRCALCNSEKNLQLHHIIPLFQRGSNIQQNLILLCNRCHKKQHSFWV
ncbi:MAG: HNH endonuclease [Mailhella sp.]|nr:HNH endonuclease [Mailhella sp.]